MNPKVSIIVPVYNAEKYLDACIKSVQDQAMSDWELLLIDDGSKDYSLSIIQQYSEKDSRIKVYAEHHAGVSHSRQVGVDNAIGEYSIHMDSDDTIEPEMLAEMYAKTKEQNADIVVADFTEIRKDGHVLQKQEPTSFSREGVLDDLMFGRLHGSLCNKLIRTDLIKESKARFHEGLSMREDFLFLCDVLSHADKISYIPKSYYNYDRRNDSSLTSHHVDESPRYYNQETLFYHLILQKDYLSPKARTHYNAYYSDLAYITLKHDLMDEKTWMERFACHQAMFLSLNLGYKSKLVHLALSGHYRMASIIRSIISKVRR